MSPGQHQAITCTKAGILLIRTLGATSVKSYVKFMHFIQESAFGNVISGMVAILSRLNVLRRGM